MDRELTKGEKDRLWDFIDEAMRKGSHFSGQTYEDGIRAVLDMLEGNGSVEDALGV